MIGAKSERPVLQETLGYLRDGEDTLFVWRLDRLGRSLKHLIEVINTLEERGIGFQSLQESIDTSGTGRLLVRFANQQMTLSELGHREVVIPFAVSILGWYQHRPVSNLWQFSSHFALVSIIAGCLGPIK